MVGVAAGNHQTVPAMPPRQKLRQQFANHPCRLHTGQLLFQALKEVGKFLVAESQQMQDRGMEVADRHLILHRLEPKIVGRAVRDATANTSAGQPDRKSIRTVIAAIRALGERRPPKFTAPDHQCGIEHATILEIPNQRGDRLVDRPGVVGMPLAESAVLIPAVGVD